MGLRRGVATCLRTYFARTRRCCTSAPVAPTTLSEDDKLQLRRQVAASVGKTAVRDWMPSFVFDFIAECKYESALRSHSDPKAEEDEYYIAVEFLDELDWRPMKLGSSLPIRNTKRIPPELFFQKVADVYGYNLDRNWTLQKGTPEKKYVLIGYAGGFPVASQPPNSWDGPERVRLLVDPDDKGAPKVLVQLCEDVPAMLCLPIQPKHSALLRLCREMRKLELEFASKSRGFWEKAMDRGEHVIIANPSFHDDEGPMLDDPNIWDVAMNSVALQRDLPNGWRIPGTPSGESHIYLGPWPFTQTLWEDILSANPMLHAWPAFRSFAQAGISEGSVARKFLPGKEAGCIELSLWVTRFSKTPIAFFQRSDLCYFNQLQWAEACCHKGKVLDDFVYAHQFAQKYPTTNRVQPHPDTARFHNFACIMHPKSSLMSGGGRLARRFNAAVDADLPEDLPVDVIAALMWFRCHGVRRLAETLERWESTVKDIPLPMDHEAGVDQAGNPWFMFAETAVKLAILQDPEWLERVFEKHHSSRAAPMRWACAKGAAELGYQDLLREMWVKEKNPILATAMDFLSSSLMSQMLGPQAKAREREEKLKLWLRGDGIQEEEVTEVRPQEIQLMYCNRRAPMMQKEAHENAISMQTAEAKKKWASRKAKGLSAMRRDNILPHLTGDATNRIVT